MPNNRLQKETKLPPLNDGKNPIPIKYKEKPTPPPPPPPKKKG